MTVAGLAAALGSLHFLEVDRGIFSREDAEIVPGDEMDEEEAADDDEGAEAQAAMHEEEHGGKPERKGEPFADDEFLARAIGFLCDFKTQAEQEGHGYGGESEDEEQHGGSEAVRSGVVHCGAR